MTDALVFTAETMPSPTREVAVVLFVVNLGVFVLEPRRLVSEVDSCEIAKTEGKVGYL
jgi:hypothetical protein